MALSLDMQKTATGLKLSLEKKGIRNPPPAEMAFVMDVSGSFDDEHRDGQTQMLLERLVPWAMVFDPDKQGDMFTFSNGPSNIQHVGTITPETTDGYIRSKIINRVTGYNGGTDYSYVLERCLQQFGWLQAPTAAQQTEKPSFFGSMFGKKPAAAAAPGTPAAKRKSIVLFVTDGRNNDENRTREVLRASQKRGDQVYFLFLGVNNQSGEFRFLEDIGREFDNTGFLQIRNIREFMRLSDEQVNDVMISDELLTWLKN
ncbi:MAG: VWA domain-containing protein [Gemmatimonadaceae bacterium]|nr:VWA domain-containing protein [Gemmatimonadaceae bacterium]